MALELTTELKTGYIANYWRITSIHLDLLQDLSVVNLSLFKDRQASLDGNMPVDIRTFEWRKDRNPLTVDNMEKENVYEIAYNRIKEPILVLKRDTETKEVIKDDRGDPVYEDKNEFSKATDVLEDGDHKEGEIKN